MGVILFIAIMVLLFKFTEVDKWILWFVVLIVLITRLGFNFGMLGIMVQIVVFKVLKDICTYSRNR